MQIGVDSFATAISEPATDLTISSRTKSVWMFLASANITGPSPWILHQSWFSLRLLREFLGSSGKLQLTTIRCRLSFQRKVEIVR